MATSNQPSARFRSAKEFPKTVEGLKSTETEKLYEEMRDCLIFTNRSRSQLLRRNEEHKQSIVEFKTRVEHLHTLVSQLTLEKQEITQNNQLVIAELNHELGSMGSRLDQLSAAFDTVPDPDTLGQSQWSILALPNHFFKFLRAVKAIVVWWREENSDNDAAAQMTGDPSPQLPGAPEAETKAEDDRLDKPQMYTDQASINRSLLDR